jgi:predicted lipoprotein with Yx(FWY)xxD motif
MRTIRFEALRGRIRRGRLTLGSAILLACVALVSAACSSSASPSTSSPPVSPSPSTATSEAVIGTTQSQLGTFLTADNGRTVYLFEKDTGSKSNCSGSCAAAWPPVTTSGMATTSGTANASLLGTTTRSDGTVQVTYAGHPVYFYTADTAPGQTNGEGVDAFGAEWYVLSPAGKKVENDED